MSVLSPESSPPVRMVGQPRVRVPMRRRTDALELALNLDIGPARVQVPFSIDGDYCVLAAVRVIGTSTRGAAFEAWFCALALGPSLMLRLSHETKVARIAISAPGGLEMCFRVHLEDVGTVACAGIAKSLRRVVDEYFEAFARGERPVTSLTLVASLPG
jgi:hypothetical protein